MVFVCKKHVNKGLTMIFLPHVQLISSYENDNGNYKCQICSAHADYKLFNFIPKREQNVKDAM
jgi:predicted nucleotide-binding protein (sugar kinase/HSP70/actin superfamily)